MSWHVCVFVQYSSLNNPDVIESGWERCETGVKWGVCTERKSQHLCMCVRVKVYVFYKL